MNQKFVQASCRATLHEKKNFSSNLNFFDVIDHRCWNDNLDYGEGYFLFKNILK
jgi:pimeloyl-CoA synthetase